MAQPSRCPYDPELQADFMLDLHDCPVCGCSIFAGLPHGPCSDLACMYYAQSMSKLRHPSSRLVTAN